MKVVTGRDMLRKIYNKRQDILVAHSKANPMLVSKPPVDRWSAYNTLTEAKKKRYITNAYDHTFGIVGKDTNTIRKNIDMVQGPEEYGKWARSVHSHLLTTPTPTPSYHPNLAPQDPINSGDGPSGGGIRSDSWASGITVWDDEQFDRNRNLTGNGGRQDGADYFDDEWGGRDNQDKNP